MISDSHTVYFNMATFFAVLACLVLRSHELHAEEMRYCHAQETTLVFGSREGHSGTMVVETTNMNECYESAPNFEYYEYDIILYQNGVEYAVPASCTENFQIDFGRIYAKAYENKLLVRFLGINMAHTIVETRALYLTEGEVRCVAVCQGMACTRYN